MMSLTFCDGRTDVDMERLAHTFGVTRAELEDCLRLGTISYWFELGSSDLDSPWMVFRSLETGRRVMVNPVRDVIFCSIPSLEVPPSYPSNSAKKNSAIGGAHAKTSEFWTPIRLGLSGAGGSSVACHPHLEVLLDEALKATFPASDPIAISFEVGRRDSERARHQ